MKPLRVAQVVGTRPQLVKAAALCRAMMAMPNEIEPVLIHTGQHYDSRMSEAFFVDLEIPKSDHYLGVGSGSHAGQTAQMLVGLEPLLDSDQVDIVLVAGDTNSTVAAGLCAAKLGTPLAHVEAGLRSFDRRMPEEVNRVVVDHLSDLLFCPSEGAAENLAREGIVDGVEITGDVMLDTMRWVSPTAEIVGATMERFGLKAGGFALATVHRAGNTDNPNRFNSIIEALTKVAEYIPVVFPAHPRIATLLREMDLPSTITVIDPVTHTEMLALAGASAIGLTDSGGLQKELYWLKTPCVTLRDETEWTETVTAGWNELAGAEPSKVVAAVQGFLDHPPADGPNLYGDGRAAERIAQSLKSWAEGR